jgi:hypothetical protein
MALPRVQTANSVIASEAKQSILSLRGPMDCFAALAMTAEHTFAFSRRNPPKFWPARSALSSEGAGKAGCPMHPQPRVVW